MHTTLEVVLILLAVAVIVAAAARALKLPALLGYLLTGIAIGPHALGWIPDSAQTRYLAEFGVVFLMFSIGLEFSLPRLLSMRTTVFGFGGAQVLGSLLLMMAAAWATGASLAWGLVLGGVLAMSSTAIVSKLLAERLELQTPHGRQIFGALLFQDLAVVPLLILVPSLAMDRASMTRELVVALLNATVVLAVLLTAGQRLMRPWFHRVAAAKSPEIFTLNVLFFTLLLAWFTEQAGLSLALGAFLAGMLISETEYRYQVEDDIKPFRDVLLGLFFVTIGMRLDLGVVLGQWPQVLLVVLALSLGKGAAVWVLSRAFGQTASTALRSALGLAQAGEFGFVLLAQGSDLGLLHAGTVQPVLAGMVLSMLLAPLLIHRTDAIVRRCCRGEWTGRAKELHDIALSTFGKEGHVIVCGYGRSGQSLTRFLDAEDIPFVALDMDPERTRAAAAAGESVVFGDAARREVLVAAGLSRARAMVITFADFKASLAILRHVQELKPELPVLVRTLDETYVGRLKEAGAAEVVPEVVEGSLMLASHTLMLLGMPLATVLKRIRRVRESHYSLMRGFFRGASDEAALGEEAQPRLMSVLLTPQAAAIGKTLGEINLVEMLVEVLSVRRRGIRGLAPESDAELQAGDVLVLRGAQENLAAAEIRLLQG